MQNVVEYFKQKKNSR